MGEHGLRRLCRSWPDALLSVVGAQLSSSGVACYGTGAAGF